jgi:hypothetical protein
MTAIIDPNEKPIVRPEIRVAVSVPTGDQLAAGFAYDLARMMAATAHQRHDIELRLHMTRDSVLPRARHDLVAWRSTPAARTSSFWTATCASRKTRSCDCSRTKSRSCGELRAAPLPDHADRVRFGRWAGVTSRMASTGSCRWRRLAWASCSWIWICSFRSLRRGSRSDTIVQVLRICGRGCIFLFTGSRARPFGPRRQ